MKSRSRCSLLGTLWIYRGTPPRTLSCPRPLCRVESRNPFIIKRLVMRVHTFTMKTSDIWRIKHSKLHILKLGPLIGKPLKCMLSITNLTAIKLCYDCRDFLSVCILNAIAPNNVIEYWNSPTSIIIGNMGPSTLSLQFWSCVHRTISIFPGGIMGFRYSFYPWRRPGRRGFYCNSA